MKHEGCKRQFVQLSRAWYSKACLVGDTLDEVTMGFYHPDGGTTGEFQIRWIPLGGRDTPLLLAYDDAWSALYRFADVLKQLAWLDGANPSPEDVCALLVKCGIEDATPTTRD